MLEAEYLSYLSYSSHQLCIFYPSDDSLPSAPTNENARPNLRSGRSDELLPLETPPAAQHVQRPARSTASRYLGALLDHARNCRLFAT